jgi:hypothetical protein
MEEKLNVQLFNLIAKGEFGLAKSKLHEATLGVGADDRIKIIESGEEPPQCDPVFICGLHRSGTTLLYDHIANGFDVAIFENPKVPEKEGQFLQDVFPMEKPYGGPGSFAFYPQMHFMPIEDPELARQERNRLLKRWSPWLTGNKQVLLEKSPPNITRIAYLRSVFPTAKFIVWTRDPRAVSLATQKWHGLSIDTLMLHWNTAYMQAFKDLDDDCIVLRYEDFCADPESELQRISRHINVPYVGVKNVQNRFKELANSNPKYIEMFPPNYRFRASVKAWEIFGYDFDSTPRWKQQWKGRQGGPAGKKN